jgi:diphthamide biosynthesis protein 4
MMTHYEALAVTPNANYGEIRAKYRAAILALHPDKLDPVSESSSSQQQAGTISSFLRVQEAWKVLRDADSRAAYDTLLLRDDGLETHSSMRRRSESACVIGEEVMLEEMEESVGEDEGGGTEKVFEYWYPCRCGEFFAVSETELKEAGLDSGEEHVQRCAIVLPCHSCSLHLRVFFWASIPSC